MLDLGACFGDLTTGSDSVETSKQKNKIDISRKGSPSRAFNTTPTMYMMFALPQKCCKHTSLRAIFRSSGWMFALSESVEKKHFFKESRVKFVVLQIGKV